MITIDFTTKPNIAHEYVIDERGYKCTYNEMNKLHSYNDMPAVVTPLGSKFWYKNGLLHRNGKLPAVILIVISSDDDIKQYYKNGKRIK